MTCIAPYSSIPAERATERARSDPRGDCRARWPARPHRLAHRHADWPRWPPPEFHSKTWKRSAPVPASHPGIARSDRQADLTAGAPSSAAERIVLAADTAVADIVAAAGGIAVAAPGTFVAAEDTAAVADTAAAPGRPPTAWFPARSKPLFSFASSNLLLLPTNRTQTE